MNHGEFDRAFELDAQRKAAKAKLHTTRTLKDYLSMVREDPLIAQNSTARILEAILDQGCITLSDEERCLWEIGKPIERYPAFVNVLFGVDLPISNIVHFIKEGAAGLSTGKQLLLIVGPPASGKSTFLTLLKKLLEDYDKRPIFCIKGCPIHEEPLHLLPRYMREQVALKPDECADPECKEKGHIHLGIRIKGDLCTWCKYHVFDNPASPYRTGNNNMVEWWNVEVEPFSFSVRASRGIGSYEPTDDKAADVGDLVGHRNLPIYATDPDSPQAFKLDGELNKANRGVFEGRELVKAQKELLWVFLSAAEEQEIKVHGSSRPHISIDMLLIGHTNLHEFTKCTSDVTLEALHDRTFVIPFPYPLRRKDEVEIYRKLIQRESNLAQLSHCHIAPRALELAATFAVLTRIKRDSGFISAMNKVRLYNGEELERDDEDGSTLGPIDVREILKEGQGKERDIEGNEGMYGISSRDVLAALNTALVEVVQDDEGRGCLTPRTVLQAIRNVFSHRMGFSPEEIDAFKELLDKEVTNELNRDVMRIVHRAFLSSYEDQALQLFLRYFTELDLFFEGRTRFLKNSNQRITSNSAGKEREADEKFLNSVENYLVSRPSEVEAFRSEMARCRNERVPENFPIIMRAVQQKLLAESRTSLSIILDTSTMKEDDERQRAKDLMRGLKELGCCEVCAREFVEIAQKQTCE